MFTEKIHILLADDDKDDCLFFKEALEDIDMNTKLTIVHDGEQLMQLLARPSKAHYHLLFLDLNMPRKNGSDCLQAIKSNEQLAYIPVIIFSTSYNVQVADQLYKNGAQHYLCKPVDFSALKQLIQQAITQVLAEPLEESQQHHFLLHL